MYFYQLYVKMNINKIYRRQFIVTTPQKVKHLPLYGSDKRNFLYKWKRYKWKIVHVCKEFWIILFLWQRDYIIRRASASFPPLNKGWNKAKRGCCIDLTCIDFIYTHFSIQLIKIDLKNDYLIFNKSTRFSPLGRS